MTEPNSYHYGVEIRVEEGSELVHAPTACGDDGGKVFVRFVGSQFLLEQRQACQQHLRMFTDVEQFLQLAGQVGRSAGFGLLDPVLQR